MAYNVKKTNTVLRVSYARVLETPFNENLVLASTGCDSLVLASLLGCVTPGVATPFAPGWRNEFHAGLQQAFGKYLVFSGEYIWKYTHNAYDFSVLGSTPITFPDRVAQLQDSRVRGTRERARLPWSLGPDGFLQRGGPVLYSSDWRRRRSALGNFGHGVHSVPHRPRRTLQPDHARAVSALEDRPMGRFQLALRQRAGRR